MRSILWRLAIPVSAFTLVSAIGSRASADAPASEPFSIVAGGRYDGPRSSDPDKRGLEIVRRLAPHARTLATSGIDRFGDGETVVRYEQVHQGLPVIGRGAAVRLSAAGDPMTTVIDVERDLPSTTSPAVAPDVAASIANRTADLGRFAVGASARDAHLVVWPTRDRGARLAYAVVPQHPGGHPDGAAHHRRRADRRGPRGARHGARSRRRACIASNPTKTPDVATLDFAIAPAGEAHEPVPRGVELHRQARRSKPSTCSASTMTVHVCDLVQVAKAERDGRLPLRTDRRAGQRGGAQGRVLRGLDLLPRGQGLRVLPRAAGRSRRRRSSSTSRSGVVANLQIPAGIGEWRHLAAAAIRTRRSSRSRTPSSRPRAAASAPLFQQLYGFDQGALWFGQGPKRDYAYDGDVVYHEFTHAVVDATLKLGAWHIDARGAIDAPGAMNEGLADYFSSAITGDPDVGEYASKDFGSAAGVIRTLANDDSCPTALVGEVHFDSTLFSGALWQARAALPGGRSREVRRGDLQGDADEPGPGGRRLRRPREALPRDAEDRFPCRRGRAREGDEGARHAPVVRADPRVRRQRRSSRPSRASAFAAPGKQAWPSRASRPGIIQIQAALPTGHPVGDVSVHRAKRRAGAGNPLGGQATPFAPVVLAKFGKPITWDVAAKAAHDADVKATAEAAPRRPPPRSRCPRDTTADAIFLQIANTGESDGAYDGIALSSSLARAPDEAPVETPPAAARPSPVGLQRRDGRALDRSFGGDLAGIAVALRDCCCRGPAALARVAKQDRRPR